MECSIPVAYDFNMRALPNILTPQLRQMPGSLCTIKDTMGCSITQVSEVALQLFLLKHDDMVIFYTPICYLGSMLS